MEVSIKSARVAVITRTKNRIILLKRAIRSVLDQEFQDWIQVIVNDGGDPAEVDALVAAHADEYKGRCLVIHNPQSLGMEAASNVGLKASDSEFVVIHDDDDAWHPSFLLRCVGFFDDNGYYRLNTPMGGVITYSTRVLESIEDGAVKIHYTESFNTWLQAVSLYRLAAGNVFPPISFLFKRQVLHEVGYFREDLPVLGDWDFHLRCAERFEIGLIKEELAYYHHRIALTNNVYGNSVIAGDDKHKIYDVLLRNEYLRQDMAQGRVGLGHLTNLSKSFETLHAQISPLELVLRRARDSRLGRWLYRYLSR